MTDKMKPKAPARDYDPERFTLMSDEELLAVVLAGGAEASQARGEWERRSRDEPEPN